MASLEDLERYRFVNSIGRSVDISIMVRGEDRVTIQYPRGRLSEEDRQIVSGIKQTLEALGIEVDA